MGPFQLFDHDIIADILVEPSAFPGIHRISETLADDLALVTGMRPNIRQELRACTSQNIIVIATHRSPLLTEWENEGRLTLSDLDNKREVYLMVQVPALFDAAPAVQNVLVIAGSDKRGTLYGMFHLSELCGVSPLVYWGDVSPMPKTEIILPAGIRILSKEPSVTYRGFFINDEWPAFGKWCTEKFGGVNANAYIKVFELLLRLKGNYLWPAMWRSSFWEDGPGLENARLADELGIIMGTSHHEPLIRAGVEWQNQYAKYGQDSTWSFIQNSTAITAFWEDGLLRGKDFENIITIGMRGENDSKLMGENATLRDNIAVVKNAIRAQNELIQKHIGKDLREQPRMLAIYKEVEDFFFGDSSAEGLRGWSEIEDVILLLSDDNYGNLRAIPSLADVPHTGGYGMYYHFDYHGAPVSYEWTNCTKLVKVWEQLTMAYEHGIRKMWIVNVGDIKGNEYPLQYMMNLAYDYEKWGIAHINSAEIFKSEWIDIQFGPALTAEQKSCMIAILDGYTKWNAIRRPESLHEGIYQNNHHENERVWQEAKYLLAQAELLRMKLPESCLLAYDSMVYYPAVASFNLLLMHTEAGMNHLLAKRGSVAANRYIQRLKERIRFDQTYVDGFHALAGGKWHHMMDSAHCEFWSWDDNNWTYPVVHEVLPIPGAKILVSFRGYDAYNPGQHWQDKEPILNDEMTRPDVDSIQLDIDCRGDADFSYTLTCSAPWLTCSPAEGLGNAAQNSRTTIGIACDRTRLHGEETTTVTLHFDFADGEKKTAIVAVTAGHPDVTSYSGAFLESQHYICMEAGHFEEKYDRIDGGWQVIEQLGRTGGVIKAFPVQYNWWNQPEKPFVQYAFVPRSAGEYTLTFYLSPRNPMQKGSIPRCMYAINDGLPQVLDIVSNAYYTEWHSKEWNDGVLNNVRVIHTTVNLENGLNRLRFYATEPNILLEQIVLCPVGKPLPALQLAPPESYRLPSQ